MASPRSGLEPAVASFPMTERFLQRGVESGRYLGGQCYIHHRGRTVVDIAFGEAAPGTQYTTSSLSQWLCCTKIPTTVTVLQQIERGALTLQTPVCEIVPEFGARDKRAVKVVHLLTHTAGFDGDPALNAVGGDWDDMVAAVCAAPLRPGASPGAAVNYTDLSAFLLLGEIVSRTAGIPFAQYVRAEVFEPLGLTDSWIGVPEDTFTAYGDRVALPHVYLGRRLVPADPFRTADVSAICAPGVGGLGPIRDLGRLLVELLDRRARRAPPVRRPAVLAPETVDLMARAHRRNLYCERYTADVSWGLGVAVDHRLFGGLRCGDGTFGHVGGVTVISFADLGNDLVVAVATNALDHSRRGWMRQRSLASIVYADLEHRAIRN